jgi:Zn-finger nucleic acid-binding protein
MKCPNDSTTLVMSERSGVEIDYCPECRGVWLDRGELDKIIDRAESEFTKSAPVAPPAAPERRSTATAIATATTTATATAVTTTATATARRRKTTGWASSSARDPPC